MKYFYRALDDRERYELEQVLLVEMNLQRWYAVTFLPGFNGECTITLQ